MAITKIHAIKSTVGRVLEYIMNDDKTQGKLLVSGFRCAAATAETDFYITEKMAKAHSRKDTTNIGGSDIKAYHMIQSFSKNEKLTAEKAHELGEELAREFLGGKYEYVLTTHVDKGHIHNHIVFNAYSQDDAKKFRTVPYKTAERLRDISDGICEKSGLLVLENAKGAGYGHWEWEERNKGSSWKEKIENRINRIIPTVTSYDEFKASMNGAGIEVDDSGKYIKYRMQGQERWTRANGKSLSLEYSKESIIDRIYASELEGLLHITIAKKLIASAADGRLYTRIPHTRQYVFFKEEDSTWYKNEASLSTFIYPDNEYEIYNGRGEIAKRIKGSELGAYYDVKERAKPQQRTEGRYKGSIKDQNAGRPLSQKTRHMVRLNHLHNVQDLALAMNVMNREEIRSYKDLTEKMQTCERQLHAATANRDAILSAKRETERKRQYAEIYNGNKKQVKNILESEDGRREQLLIKYADAIAAFAHAESELSGMDMDNLDSSAFGKEADLLDEQLKAAQDVVDALEAKSGNLAKARDVVKMVFGKQEDEQERTRPRPQDRGRS